MHGSLTSSLCRYDAAGGMRDPLVDGLDIWTNYLVLCLREALRTRIV